MNTYSNEAAQRGGEIARKSREYDESSVEGVKAALENIRAQVGGPIKELRERLQGVEQRVADANPGGWINLPAGINFTSITESEGFQRFRANQVDKTEHYQLDLRLKSLVNLTTESASGETTFPTLADRAPGLHGIALRRLRLLDVMLSRPVKAGVTQFVQINMTGEAEVQDHEGDEKAEAVFEGELQTANVATVAVHTTASAQVLDDNEGLASELSRIMGHSVLSKVEQQLLVGSGSAGKINGLYTQATAIATYENAIPDRIGSALTQMDVLGYTPNVIVMNPVDWFAISIMKDGEGRYLHGDPTSPTQPSLWNLPVVTTPSLPSGTALVGDTTQARVLDRMEPTVYLSRDFANYRIRNLVLILVEARLGLELYDALAFRRVDLRVAT